jgi:HEAT repeat protein
MFFFFLIPAFGQEQKTESAVLKEWGETLDYGIDTQIIEVIKKIRDAGDQSFNTRLIVILGKSLNPAVRKEILDYFVAIKYREAEKTALTILSNYENEDPELVRSLIGYLSEIKSQPSLELIVKLIDANDKLLAYTAIMAVGKMGDLSKTALLLAKLKDPEFPGDRKSTIIQALGELKALEAVGELIKIAENTSEDHFWRINAAASLGKIGDAKALPVLKKLFAETDPLLKAAAANALGNFDISVVIDLLIEGLKDSYWKVRVASCQGLARPGAAKAVDILTYKVTKDPETPVRIEAMKTLAAIGTGQAFVFLRQVLEDKGKPPQIREFAFTTLVEKNLTSETVDSIERTVKLEWDSKDPRLLEVISRKLITTESVLIKKILVLFLNHNSFVIKAAGIRGIARNHFNDLRGRLEEMEKKDPNETIRKEARQALDKM